MNSEDSAYLHEAQTLFLLLWLVWCLSHYHLWTGFLRRQKYFTYRVTDAGTSLTFAKFFWWCPMLLCYATMLPVWDFLCCEEASVKLSCWSLERSAEKKNSAEVLLANCLDRERLEQYLRRKRMISQVFQAFLCHVTWKWPWSKPSNYSFKSTLVF